MATAPATEALPRPAGAVKSGRGDQGCSREGRLAGRMRSNRLPVTKRPTGVRSRSALASQRMDRSSLGVRRSPSGGVFRYDPAPHLGRTTRTVPLSGGLQDKYIIALAFESIQMWLGEGLGEPEGAVRNGVRVHPRPAAPSSGPDVPGDRAGCASVRSLVPGHPRSSTGGEDPPRSRWRLPRSPGRHPG